MKKIVFMLSLICGATFAEEKNCHENINKDFSYCKEKKSDDNPRTWYRQRNQLGCDGKPTYQWCKEVYTSSDKYTKAESIKGHTVKHGFGDDCEFSKKGCLTDNC
jgi:hypothetical protein